MKKISNSKNSFLKYEWKKRKFGVHTPPPMAYDLLQEIFGKIITDMEEEADKYNKFLNSECDGLVKLSKFKKKYYRKKYEFVSDDDDSESPQVELGFKNKKVKFDYDEVNEDQSESNYEIIEDEQPTFKKHNANGLTKILDKNLDMESKRLILDQKLLEFEQKKGEFELNRLDVEKEKLEIERERLELDKKKFEFEKEKLEFEKKKFELDEKKLLLKMKELNLDSFFD